MKLVRHNTALSIGPQTLLCYDKYHSEWQQLVRIVTAQDNLPEVNAFLLEDSRTGIRISDAQMLYYFSAYVATLHEVTPKLAQSNIVKRLRSIRSYWHQNLRSEEIFNSEAFKYFATKSTAPTTQ